MKVSKSLLVPLFVLILSGCKKHPFNHQQIIPIPNGDFEQWDNIGRLMIWQTNSCPPCLPPYETYIVKKVPDAANGQFAAKFIFNGLCNSYANNKFQISLHPPLSSGYVKSNLSIGDSATIHIDLFSGSNIVDGGDFIETAPNGNYRKIGIPISQNSASVDSVLIKIIGGRKQGTELYVDNLAFEKND
jgi:hypothetical protein